MTISGVHLGALTPINMGELESLKDQMPPEAVAQLNQIDAMIPAGSAAREPNDDGTSVGWLTSQFGTMRGHPDSGSVGVGETAYAPFLRIRLNQNPTPDVLLYSLESEDDDRRYLTALDSATPDYPPFLQADASSPGTRWTMYGADPGPIWLRAADLGASGHWLNGNGGPVKPGFSLLKPRLVTGPAPPNPANAWGWTLTPPKPDKPRPVRSPPMPGLPTILAETFWWGFHLIVPEPLMDDWTHSGIAAGQVLNAVAAFTGPAEPFIAAIAEYIEGEFALARAVDHGNGVFVSMSWFAPLLFLPTPM